MIKVENIETWGFEHAVRGMRNPLNSWEKSDSRVRDGVFEAGKADLNLMKKLCDAGPEHRKFMRQIMVSMDIVAPLYWWKQFETYKVGTVSNSSSTMHRIHSKPFSRGDFSCERLNSEGLSCLDGVIATLNECRGKYLALNDKEWWWQLVQLLPSSYNQLRTVTFSYENARNMMGQRASHKLGEWVEFCNILKGLPLMGELAG